MENDRIAALLEEIADLLELKEAQPFRIRSYRRAARTIREWPGKVADLVRATPREFFNEPGKQLSGPGEHEDSTGHDGRVVVRSVRGLAEDPGPLTELPFVGPAIAAKIRDLVRTGSTPRLDELRAEYPAGLPALMRIPGVGARKAIALHRALGIRNVEELRAACVEHRVRALPGMGPKTEERILEGILHLEREPDRRLFIDAARYATNFGAWLSRIPGIARWETAGSLRRRCETIGHLDFLVLARDRNAVAEAILAYPMAGATLARDREALSQRWTNGVQADIRFADEENFGAAWIQATGSPGHTGALRERARERGWELGPRGLFAGDQSMAGASEAEVYERLGLAWIPPELREQRGEIEAAEQDALPELVRLEEIRGDLQSHTRETDGRDSLEAMAAAARARGYAYLAVTDHSRALRMVNGLDDQRTLAQAERVRAAGSRWKDFSLLAGIEVDILRDGSLDLADATLRALDWVVAGVHSHMRLPFHEQTDRLVRAIASGLVDCLAHPLGRIIPRRGPMPFDLDKVFAACRDHGVCLEINAQPDRRDLPDVHCRRARDGGVRFAVNTDAHRASDFDFLPFGVHTARRGWLTARDIVNTRGIAELRAERGRARAAS